MRSSSLWKFLTAARPWNTRLNEYPEAATAIFAVIVIFGGISIDASARAWSQPVANVWAWCAFAWLMRKACQAERRQLLACLVLAAAGEVFLGLVWGLYEYRLRNLPLFIPPGHVVVYTAGLRLARFAPRGLPALLAAVLGPVAVAGAVRGYDTQGLIWYMLLLAYLVFGANKHFYATMFLFSLVVEVYGTNFGAWRYMAADPWLGLTTVTAPPLWAGVFYCTLDVLVLSVSASTPSGSAGSERRTVLETLSNGLRGLYAR